MEYRAWFECINDDCREKYELGEVIYNCRKCGELLEVVHDVEALKNKGPDEWKKIFSDRYMRTQWPYGSGVWGKKEWILPGVKNENVVSMYEGGTNLFWAERLGKILGQKELWVKMCGNSHTGSFKDLGMTVLVSQVKQMRASGAAIPAVACASSAPGACARAAGAPARKVRHKVQARIFFIVARSLRRSGE